jgi:uncharacterized protein
MSYQVHITQSCNLNCKYCSQSHKDSKQNMSRATAIKCTDFIFAHFLETKQEQPLCVNITGGEPLLRFDLFTLIIDTLYAKAKAINIAKPYIEISTNATLLKQAHMDYLADKNYALYIGFDGAEKSHDTNRTCLSDGSGSYTKAFENIRKYCLENDRVKAVTTLNMVVTPNNVCNFFENFQFIYELLAGKNISVNIAYEQEWDGQALGMLEKEFNKIAQFYIKILTTTDKRFSIKLIDDQLIRTIGNSKPGSANCGAATHVFTIGTNGNIYACGGFSFSGIDEDAITIGNIYDGVNSDLVKKFLSNAFASDDDECRECAFIDKCLSHCPALNWAGSKRMTKVSYRQCEINKIIIGTCDIIIDQLYKNHYDLFREKFPDNSTNKQLIS